jgi:nitroimidazol reductase NimA-like FMN-containing flavoprotein (pyridoxamine 5'-phosphate oxidase superfamily)
MRRTDREISDIELIESIISRCDVCRVAFADNNVPYIVAMNFGYSGGENPILWFHCASSGRKLEMIAKNNLVCFEMDTDHEIYRGERGCDWGMKYSSVVGYGNINIVTQDDDRKRGLDCIMAHYGGGGVSDYDHAVMKRTVVLKLEIKEITAKQKK